MHSSADIKSHGEINRRHFISQPLENSSSSSSSSRFHGSTAGILYTPPFSLSDSHLLNPRHHQKQNQPPLLPLPIPKPYQNNRRINNRTNHKSRCVRKSNFSIASSGTEKSKHEFVKASSDSMIISSINRFKPHPDDVPRVSFSGNSNNGRNDQVVKFSGSVVSSVLSPPPTSLPLPTFSLMPKLSCNTEATAVIDAGATDNLRRILRLP